jgi:predicted patatin/cPLA2 family phospholipase
MLKGIDYKSRECLARTSCPKRQQKPILLSKGQSNYNKLQKEMNEAPKDYNNIKKLIESNENNNNIEKISNNIQPKSAKMIAHKKR